MARDINVIVLSGRLTRDPEAKLTKTNQKPYLSFSVANNPGGDQQDSNFFDCRLWDKLGEIMGGILKKGMMVMLEGKMKLSTYKSESGENKKFTCIDVDSIQVVSKPREGNEFGGFAE